MPFVTTPRFIEVHRLGVFPDRSLDIDVVFDLMIHDLDIILALVKAEPTSIEAVGVPVLTDKFDIANARLRFATGCIANVTASRISKERVRKIRFFQPDAYVSIDYAEQEVEGYRLKRRDGQRPEIQGGKLPVDARGAAQARADRLRPRRPRQAPRRWSPAKTAAAPSPWRRRLLTRWRRCESARSSKSSSRPRDSES